MKKEWLKQLRENPIKNLPILSFPVVELLGISVFDLINGADYQARGMKKIIDLYPTSAAVMMMDLSVEAEAFGSTIRYFDMEVPTVIGNIINDEYDANNLKIPCVETNRTGVYVEGIKKASKLITTHPIFAGVIGPFSLAGRLIGMTEAMVNCYIEPKMVHTVLKKVTTFLTNYILAFKKAGASGVIIAEPAAGVLSPELCEEFSSNYLKEICETVKDDSFIVVYHNCGNTIPLIKSIIDIDADIYHFGNYIDLEDIIKLMPNDKIVMGNLDPVTIFKNGNPSSIKQATFALLDKCCKYDNFVISSGCDIPPNTSWQNIEAFFEAIKQYSQLKKTA